MKEGSPPLRRLKAIRLDPIRILARSTLAQLPEHDEAEHGAATHFRWRYAGIGVLLALGAPLGALVLRALLGAGSIRGELAANAFFYLYTLIGSAIVFGLAGFIAGAIADTLSRERDQFLELSERDELTGLLNSRAFWERYRRALDKVARFHEPLSLLVIDVDGLKRVNDEDGHRYGSRTLKLVAGSIERVKRDEDVLARWGGDEFVLLMPGAPSSAAVRVAARVLEEIRSRPVRTSRTERSVAVTIGIASSEPGENPQGLFDRADAALYVGKRHGGNQYQVSGSERA